YSVGGVELKGFEKSVYELNVLREEKVKRGQTYSMSSAVFHKTVASYELTATLLKTEINLDREPYVLTESFLHERKYFVERNPKDKKYVDDLVSEFLERIK